MCFAELLCGMAVQFTWPKLESHSLLTFSQDTLFNKYLEVNLTVPTSLSFILSPLLSLALMGSFSPFSIVCNATFYCCCARELRGRREGQYVELHPAEQTRDGRYESA